MNQAVFHEMCSCVFVAGLWYLIFATAAALRQCLLVVGQLEEPQDMRHVHDRIASCQSHNRKQVETTGV